MGAFLDKPKTEKYNESGSAGRGSLRYGLSSMQGWRVEMEDAHVACTSLPAPLSDAAFFAVFDGHAGAKIANHSSECLLDYIMRTDDFKKLIDELMASKLAAESLKSKESDCGNPKPVYLDHRQAELVASAMKCGFLSLDEQMRTSPLLYGENERSGTTCVCAIVAPSHIFVANLGDSRAVFSRNGAVYFATEDHKPYLPRERERIVSAGGSVMIQRVNGSLAVSRALGDYDYKSVTGLKPCDQLVSPEPDVHVIEREKSPTPQKTPPPCTGSPNHTLGNEPAPVSPGNPKVVDEPGCHAKSPLASPVKSPHEVGPMGSVPAAPFSPTNPSAQPVASKECVNQSKGGFGSEGPPVLPAVPIVPPESPSCKTTGVATPTTAAVGSLSHPVDPCHQSSDPAATKGSSDQLPSPCRTTSSPDSLNVAKKFQMVRTVDSSGALGAKACESVPVPLRDEFLILACDGVFDVMTNQELCDFVRSRLYVTNRLETICNQILDSCLSKGSKDNMSLVLVTFPGAPQISHDCIAREEQFEFYLRERINEIVSQRECFDDVDSEFVWRALMSQEIPGLPPGAGLHAVLGLVESTLESIKSQKPKPQLPHQSSAGSGAASSTTTAAAAVCPAVNAQPSRATPSSAQTKKVGKSTPSSS